MTARQRRYRSLGVTGEAAHPYDEERLYFAIDVDDYVLLRMQLEVAGIDANCRFPGHLGKSALQLCCEKGHLECAKLLIEAGADTGAQDEWFHTPLISSVSTGRCDMVRLLVSSGCNMEIKDKYGKTAVHYAVNDVETSCLEELIKSSADVDALDEYGRAPVWLAAEMDGRLDSMRMLVDAGCDVNNKDKREKRTPLQVAILKSSSDLLGYVKLLLKAGARTDIVDLLGHSPMSCLIQRVSSTRSDREINQIDPLYMEVGRLLLDSGYDVNFTSTAHYPFQFHGTSLKMAAVKGVVPLVKLLLEYDADPDASDDKNTTPLHHAVFHNFQEICKLLIRANCALDRLAEMTFSGQILEFVTPFACAAILGNVEIVDIFLLAGYDVRRDLATPNNLITLSQHWTSRMTSSPNEDLEEKLFYWYSNPRPLSVLCRSLARGLLGRHIEKKVNSLSLPIGIKNNLLLTNVI